MHFEIEPNRTVFCGVTGSHAYGMATESSDLDVRGIVRTPTEIKLSTTKSFEQHQGDCPLLRNRWVYPSTPDLVRRALTTEWNDCTIYDLVKACHLMAQANPNMLELLWLPEECIIYRTYYTALTDIRDAFLSKKVKYTYSGYAFAQWKKIASHRSWLLHPPKKKPERADFGLPETSLLSADDRSRIEEAIQATLRSWNIDDFEMGGAQRDVLRDRMADFWATTLQCDKVTELDDEMRVVAGMQLGLSNAVLDVLSAERKYRAALKHWNHYLLWKENRNKDRAELEAKFGYDTKHASHLIRLLRMGTEILSGKGVLVKRPDAEELLEIRRGKYTYEQLDEMAKAENQLLEEAAKTTSLSHGPDLDKIDRAILYIYARTP